MTQANPVFYRDDTGGQRMIGSLEAKLSQQYGGAIRLKNIRGRVDFSLSQRVAGKGPKIFRHFQIQNLPFPDR